MEAGGVVTTTIKCQNGETMVVTFDTRLPRPYSLLYRVQGTDGIWSEEESVYIEDRSPEHEWETVENYRDEFEAPALEDVSPGGREAQEGARRL